MPPRYAYWTILVDGGPTAFRAAEPDELLPTLKRLQVKQPGATMKWFQKGRLWESRDEASDKLEAGYTVGPDGALVPPPEGFERRTKSWRPGGEHRDPREKYQLAKKAKWQKFKQMVRARPGHGPKTEEDVVAPRDGDVAPDESHAYEPESFDRPDGSNEDRGRDDAPAPSADWRGRPTADGGASRPKRPWSDRPKTPGRPTNFDRGGDRPRGPKPAWRDKPQGGWSGKPGGGSGGARPAWTPRPDARGPKPEWRDRPKPSGDRPFSDRPRGPKPEWRDKPQGGWGDKPGGGGARPAWTPRPDARGPKPEWRDRPKPSGDRPFSDRPRGPKPEWRDKPQGGWGDKPGGGGARPAWTPRPDARGPKPEWRDRPKPSGDRPFSDRPRGPKPEWRDKPQGGWGDKPGGGGARPAWTPRPDARGPKPEWRDRPKPSGDRPFSDRPRGPKPGGSGGFSRPGPKGGSFGARPRGRSGPPKKRDR